MEEKKKEKKSSDNIKKVAIGGVVGVMLGSSGVAAAQTLMQGEEAEGEAVEPEVDVQIEEAADGELHVAHGVENIDFSKIISLNESAAYLWEKVHDHEFTDEELVRLLKENDNIVGFMGDGINNSIYQAE